LTKEKFWRIAIGHYGGLRVEVPAEHFPWFRQQMPKKYMPREIQKRSVSELFTDFGAKRFNERFQKSQGTVFGMWFRDRSKGAKRIEDMFPHESHVIEPFE
jgi:hypothetical protein